MLLKPGVDISRLNRPVRRILGKLDKIYKNYGDTLVITSTYEGNHSPASLHYANNAIDIRLPAREVNKVLADIKIGLGLEYDVIKEVDHIHVEHDPHK